MSMRMCVYRTSTLLLQSVRVVSIIIIYHIDCLHNYNEKHRNTEAPANESCELSAVSYVTSTYV